MKNLPEVPESTSYYLKNFVQACKEKNRHVPRSKYQPFKPDILYWGQ